jgi:putative oxidoreductase
MSTPPVLRHVAALLGRILLAAIFVISGYGKIGSFSTTAAYMATKGLPMPEVLLALTIFIELGGGLMILVGWRARLAALVIFLFLIPVTYLFHPFWLADAASVKNQMNQFLKNLAIMGGMLYVLANGPGALSLGRPGR